jgi:uncharacterized protein (TIGR03086 family)
MEPTEQLSYVLPTFSSMVDRVEAGQLDDPTPCSGFTVRDLLNHFIVLGGSFAYWFRGEEAPELTPPAANGSVPAREVREVLDGVLEAAKSPGAMERIISAPVGEMPGSTCARFIAFDCLIHTWDLASATGLEFEVPPALIASADEFARDALTSEMRDGDTFKEATVAPDGSSRLEGLVAYSGRSV